MRYKTDVIHCSCFVVWIYGHDDVSRYYNVQIIYNFQARPYGMLSTNYHCLNYGYNWFFNIFIY